MQSNMLSFKTQENTKDFINSGVDEGGRKILQIEKVQEKKQIKEQQQMLLDKNLRKEKQKGRILHYRDAWVMYDVITTMTKYCR